MHWIDWLITIVPVTVVIFLAVYSRKYVRGVVDYLAAGRVAGRYVMSAGDLTSGLSVISLVALVEAKYQVGYALTFWEFLTIPVGIIMGLTGYCVYRFRETRSLSIGQFLEMRYNRPLRIVAATIRTVSEMMTNAIGPAVAANFFIYFLGLPHKVMLFGINLPTFGLIVALSLCLCMVIIWPGGRISLLISDAFQGLMSYPIFVIIAGYVFLHFGWSDTVGPVMMDRVKGESFINPFDIEKLRDFNIFALFVTIMGQILNRASWIGNDTTNSGRTPHEQKMAGILASWRALYANLMLLLIAVMIIALMTHQKYAEKNHEIRQELTQKVAEEAVAEPQLRDQLNASLDKIPIQAHRIGVDKPLSHDNNIDTPYIKTAQKALAGTPEGNLQFQKFRTLYHQMMLLGCIEKHSADRADGAFLPFDDHAADLGPTTPVCLILLRPSCRTLSCRSEKSRSAQNNIYGYYVWSQLQSASFLLCFDILRATRLHPDVPRHHDGALAGRSWADYGLRALQSLW